jgi:hypothetical protein
VWETRWASARNNNGTAAWKGWHPYGMRGVFCIASGGVASLNRPANGFDASGIGTNLKA